MVFQVTGANSRRTKVAIRLACDINGDPAFDEDDRPVKGRDPVTLVLPRYNYIPFDQLKELIRLGAEVEKRELSDDYSVMDRTRDSLLEQFRPLVDEPTFGVLQQLSLGELQEINTEWSARSNEPLGESSASNGSSKNTRRPSTTTSSAAVTASTT